MYRFNLESLLNYRRYQEEILQKELADLKNQLIQREQLLHQMKQDRYNQGGRTDIHDRSHGKRRIGILENKHRGHRQ